MSLTWSGFSDVTKELYPDGIDEDLLYKQHPLLGMVQRRRDFFGRYLHIPIRYGKPQGISSYASTAATNEYASKFEAFQVTRVNDFGYFKLDGEVVDAAKGGSDQVFVDSVKAEIDGALSSLGDKLGHRIYRGTSGSRATVGSGTSSPITLANIEDIYFFEVGQVISANDTDNTTTPRSGTGTITAIDEDAGTITYSGTITSLAVGDYLFVSGDEGLCGAGLDAWCPSSAPGATSFFGVDRSVQTTRLGGVRFSASTLAMEEVPIRAMARARRSSIKVDYAFINPSDLADFEVAKEGSKFITSSKEYSFGIEGLSAYGIKFIPDPNCQVGTMWMLEMGAFGWATMGDAPRVFDGDGLELIRVGGGADSYEGQIVARHNWWSDAPGKIMRVTLPA